MLRVVLLEGMQSSDDGKDDEGQLQAANCKLQADKIECEMGDERATNTTKPSKNHSKLANGYIF